MHRSGLLDDETPVPMTEISAGDGIIRRLVRYDHLADTAAIERLAVSTRAAAEDAGCGALMTVAIECRALVDLNKANYPDALRGYNDAMRRWQERGDRAGEARSRVSYARTLLVAGLTTEAFDQAYEALRLVDETTEPTVHIGALLMISRAKTILRDWDEAGRFIQKAVDAARASGDPFEIGRALCVEGYLFCERSREARARGDRVTLRALALQGEHCNREGDAICQQTGQRSYTAVLRLNLGECLMDLDRLDEAAEVVERVLVDAGESFTADPYYQAESLITLAQIRRARDGQADAIEDFVEALDIATTHGMNALAMKCHELLADAHEARGDFQIALRHHRRYFDAYQQVQSEAAQLRSSVLAVQHEIVEARAAVATERKRAEHLESTNRQLARESLEDPLTGLANRRSFVRVFESIADQHATDGDQFFLAVLDVDDFKRVNDVFSHSVGDEVLKAIAALLRAESRVGDVAARYGGEEFTLLMQNTTRAGATAVCERVCDAVRRWPWNDIATGMHVTISAGVAGSRECANRAALFDLADRRLYVAKGSGKDQVVADAS